MKAVFLRRRAWEGSARNDVLATLAIQRIVHLAAADHLLTGGVFYDMKEKAVEELRPILEELGFDFVSI